MIRRKSLVGFIALDALAFVGGGALLTLGLAAMLPYGHPQHSAAAVLAVYAAKFVIAPAVALVALAKIALSRDDDVGLVVLAAPLPLWPLFVFEALK